MAAGAAARPAPATRAGAAQPRPAPARRPQRRPARPPRRMSGAAARAAARGGGVALPRVFDAPFARSLRARTSGVMGALLAGRGWIILIGVLLAGIVFFNVDLLRMNREIALTAEKSTVLKRENARLRRQAALLGSSERIQDAAAELGMVLPGAGDVRYLKAHPEFDARKAARSITEPTDMAALPAPVVTAAPPATTATPPATTDPAGTDPTAAVQGTTTTDPAASPPTTTTTAPVVPATPTATSEGGAVAPETTTTTP
jgi:cell division protein FtsL